MKMRNENKTGRECVNMKNERKKNENKKGKIFKNIFKYLYNI